MKFAPILLILFSFLVNAETVNKIAFTINPNSPDLKWGPCPPIFPKTCELTALHGDPSKPNADMLLKIKKGAYLAAHTHTSAERMILVGGKMEIKYQGQEKRILKKGDYAYGPAKRPHEGKCLSGTCLLFIAFEQPVDALIFEGELD